MVHFLPPTLALLPSAWTAWWAYGYFYGAQPAGLALTIACGLLTWRFSRGVLRWMLSPLSPSRDLPYEAHWATVKEVREFVMKGQMGKGVVLGHHGAGLLGIYPGVGGQKELGHFLVCAPSRAGKGLHLIYNLLQWRHSTITVDIKGENYAHTAGYRQQHSRVLVLDPSGRGQQYDPFAELGHSPEGLRAAALLILEPEEDRDKIFAERASSALYAGMLAARLADEPTLLYLRNQTADGLLGYVKALHKLGNAEVNRALVDFLGRRPSELTKEDLHNDRFLNSSWVNMITRLQPLFSKGILQMTAGSDFRAADFFESPHSLYLIFRESELQFTGKALQIVLLALITALIRTQDLSDHPPKETILFGFDEAGRVPIPRLPDLVSTVAGRGMSALIYVQDIAQLEGAYKFTGAKTIKNNCHTQMFFRPYDLDTARYVSDMTDHTTIVEVEEMERLESKGLGMDKRRSETFRMRALITPGEVRQLPRDRVIIFTQDRPPILARRLVYYRIPWALKASQIEAPEVPIQPEALLTQPATKKPRSPKAGAAKPKTNRKSKANTGSEPDANQPPEVNAQPDKTETTSDAEEAREVSRKVLGGG